MHCTIDTWRASTTHDMILTDTTDQHSTDHCIRFTTTVALGTKFPITVTTTVLFIFT